MAVAEAAGQNIAQRIQDEVERAIQRSIKGLEYLAAPAPAVGLTPKNIMLLCHDVALSQAQMEMYGIADVF